MAAAKKPETAETPSLAENIPAPRKAVKAKAVSTEKPAASPKPEKTAAPLAEAAPAQPVPEPKPAEAEKPKQKDKKEKKKAKKKDKKKKEAVIIRFDDAQLPLIDARAEALGLSRAAWVRMVVATALA